MSDDLIKFIKCSISQKEVSLVIVKSETEIQEVAKTLEKYGYNGKYNTLEIIKAVSQPSKIFIIFKENISKDIYDFIIQYPTGQIEIYDQDKLKSEIVTPIYKDVSVILIADENIINKSQFSILEKIGLTYRSNL